MDFIAVIQRYLATTTISASTLRNQGAPGVIDCARVFLTSLDLSTYSGLDAIRYTTLLDRDTDAMLATFPQDARSWGAARKAMNLFLREALYNTYLSREFGLDSIEQMLEVPLDKIVAESLKQFDTAQALPPWLGLKALNRRTSDRYQWFANEHSAGLGLARVHLDPLLWTQNRSTKKRHTSG